MRGRRQSVPSSSALVMTLPRFIFQFEREGLDEFVGNSFIVVGVEGSVEIEVASDGDMRYSDLFGQEVDLLEEGYLRSRGVKPRTLISPCLEKS